MSSTMKNFRAIIASHNTPALRKFVRESNLSTTGMKRGEIISLMEKNYTRFLHIKPNTDRYKRKPKMKSPAKKVKKPTLVAPHHSTHSQAKFKAHYDPFLTKSLGTPKTPMLKTPKPRNPLKDVQFKSMY